MEGSGLTGGSPNTMMSSLLSNAGSPSSRPIDHPPAWKGILCIKTCRGMKNNPFVGFQIFYLNRKNECHDTVGRNKRAKYKDQCNV